MVAIGREQVVEAKSVNGQTSANSGEAVLEESVLIVVVSRPGVSDSEAKSF